MFFRKKNQNSGVADLHQETNRNDAFLCHDSHVLSWVEILQEKQEKYAKLKDALHAAAFNHL
jgi:hypothetical protein